MRPSGGRPWPGTSGCADNPGVTSARRRFLRTTLDVAVPTLTVLFLTMLILDPAQQRSDALALSGVLCALGSGIALIWRRVHPGRTMIATLVLGLGFMLLVPYSIFVVAGLVALWSLTVARPPAVSLPGLAGVLGLTALAFGHERTEDVWFGMVLSVAIWALAEAVRSRRAAIGEAGRRAAGEEQARLARELHDVIAHSVSVIVVQAAAADDVFDTRPDQARQAVRSIEATGREALRELRRLLGQVSPPAAGHEGPAPVPAPTPGLARLEELTAPLRAAGLEVAVRREGPGGPAVPAGVDSSAYRIVQEALTNTLRHAGASSASVTIRAAGGTLELDVRDDGRGCPAEAAGGRGLAGMRERAALLGGTLDAGPLPEGGFRVLARLPLGAAR
jgi:signal transduction histidine kinase